MGFQFFILGELLIIGLILDIIFMFDFCILVDWIICLCLFFMGGVVQVVVLGGDIKEYQVLFDFVCMKYYNVMLVEVMNVICNMNQNVNGGVIYEYGNEYIVCGVFFSYDVVQLLCFVIKMVEGVFVILEDIVDVKIGLQEFKLGIVLERGKFVVLLIVIK